jgi:hypothetical protein
MFETFAGGPKVKRFDLGWVAFVGLLVAVFASSGTCEQKKKPEQRPAIEKPAKPVQAPIKRPEGEPERVVLPVKKSEPTQAPAANCSGGSCSVPRAERQQWRPVRRLFGR